MTAIDIQKTSPQHLRITIDFDLQGNTLQIENNLQQTFNQAGSAAMGFALELCDTDGAPLKIGPLRFTSKGQFTQTYETLFGPVDVKRHVYQSQHGGQTFCPMEEKARCVRNATPKYADVVAFKYAALGAPQLRADLKRANARSISNDYAKDLSEFVAAAICAKEPNWEYDIPPLPKPVASVAVGLDGTCVLMRDDGWRQAMCGSLSLYDAEGERMHTIYVGAAPEYGKAQFHERFERELERVKESYPDALYVGLADGAPDNWSWLEPRTDRQLVDFYHAREYVGKAARAIFGDDAKARESWEADWSHRLKHERGVVARLLGAMKKALAGLKGLNREDVVRRYGIFRIMDAKCLIGNT